MREILYGFYGTMIYLPLSGLSRKWRRFSMRINNKEGGFLQQINLPGISWKQCTNKKIIEIREHDEVNGNI
ncbi:MAG: hypothetical protein HN737_07430, partial [Desulfobacterales bacterium]|nr:hypothetical protein [Desulfobacterales bacterium]